MKNFLKRALADQTPGSFTSRGQDDDNFTAMSRAARKLGFDGHEWYVDCQKACLEAIDQIVNRPSLTALQGELRTVMAKKAKALDERFGPR